MATSVLQGGAGFSGRKHVLVVGGLGVGKTTTANLILGLLPTAPLAQPNIRRFGTGTTTSVKYIDARMSYIVDTAALRYRHLDVRVVDTTGISGPDSVNKRNSMLAHLGAQRFVHTVVLVKSALSPVFNQEDHDILSILFSIFGFNIIKNMVVVVSNSGDLTDAAFQDIVYDLCREVLNSPAKKYASRLAIFTFDAWRAAYGPLDDFIFCFGSLNQFWGIVAENAKRPVPNLNLFEADAEKLRVHLETATKELKDAVDDGASWYKYMESSMENSMKAVREEQTKYRQEWLDLEAQLGALEGREMTPDLIREREELKVSLVKARALAKAALRGEFVEKRLLYAEHRVLKKKVAEKTAAAQQKKADLERELGEVERTLSLSDRCVIL